MKGRLTNILRDEHRRRRGIPTTNVSVSASIPPTQSPERKWGPIADHPIVVYHAAGMGNWQEVVAEQMTLLRECGLTQIRLTHVGVGLEWILRKAEENGINAHVVRSDPNVDHYETFAMFEIDRLAREEQVTQPILYFHTKGVSAPHDQMKMHWRRSMEHTVVRNWRHNMELLKDHDAVGQNYYRWGEAHFSGNFWLVRPEWIRRLPDFVSYHNHKNRVRYSCELWLLSTHGHHIVSVGCEGIHFTQVDYKAMYPPRSNPTITWVTLATPEYLNDLTRLLMSTSKLGQGQEVVARIVPCSPFRHTIKFDILREMLPVLKTSHVFWIDADCEFLVDPRTENLIDSNKPLTAVRHFCFGNPLHHLPGHLHSKVVNKELDMYWQSCLFGGTVEAMRSLLEDLRWMEREGVTYDEHGFVIEINKRHEQVHTIPCRFATPSSFRPFASAESLYNERAGGPSVVTHHNRNINR